MNSKGLFTDFLQDLARSHSGVLRLQLHHSLLRNLVKVLQDDPGAILHLETRY